MRDILRDGFGASQSIGPLGKVRWVTWSTIAFVITAVSVPTQAVLYDVYVPIAFVLGILQGGSVLLAALRPWWGAIAHIAAVVGFVAAAEPEGAPWPMPVLGMIALGAALVVDRKSTRLNSSHVKISYAVFCLKKKNEGVDAERIKAV